MGNRNNTNFGVQLIMAQFTIYKSTDTGAPKFYGTTGSVVALLDACLVNGYGIQPGAGWTKPLANTGSGAFSQSYGCWLQPTGSGMTLFINDGAPGAGTYKEAFATGWENLVSLSSSVSNTQGSGSGQFPTIVQTPAGYLAIRKSNTADSSSLRPWIVAADSSSLYLFIQTGDAANTYYGFGFGDIYSFKSGSLDAYKCIIMGRSGTNTAAAANDGFDYISNANSFGTAVGGNFMPRTWAGIGTSLATAKHGDGTKGNANFSLGSVVYPNASDTALYLSPIWVVEPTGPVIRGFLRGFYQFLHPATSVVDGQLFNGSLDYAGKSFMAIKTTPNSAVYIIETSNTLLTN